MFSRSHKGSFTFLQAPTQVQGQAVRLCSVSKLPTVCPLCRADLLSRKTPCLVVHAAWNRLCVPWKPNHDRQFQDGRMAPESPLQLSSKLGWVEYRHKILTEVRKWLNLRHTNPLPPLCRMVNATALFHRSDIAGTMAPCSHFYQTHTKVLRDIITNRCSFTLLLMGWRRELLRMRGPQTTFHSPLEEWVGGGKYDSICISLFYMHFNSANYEEDEKMLDLICKEHSILMCS